MEIKEDYNQFDIFFLAEYRKFIRRFAQSICETQRNYPRQSARNETAVIQGCQPLLISLIEYEAKYFILSA